MNKNPFLISLKNYFSEAQLQAIQKTHIGIAGAGGIGSNIAYILIRSGFQHFEIIDHDTVQTSNLNRQLFYPKDLNQPKVLCLKKHLLNINPQAQIITHQKKWTPQNANDFFHQATFIIEGFDVASTKKQLIEAYTLQKKYIVSGNGMAGLNIPTQANQVRRVGNVFFVGDEQTSIDQGHFVMAPRLLQCVAKMAEIVLDLTLEKIFIENC